MDAPAGTAAVSAGSNAGSGSTALIPSGYATSNGRSVVVLTTGTNPTSGPTLLTLNFSTAFALEPACGVEPYGSAAAAALKPYIFYSASTSMLTLSLAVGSPIAANTSYAFAISCGN